MNDIINRIKKLLALANCAGAANGEASNAAGKAHALLAEYNLSLADVVEKKDDKAVIEEHTEQGNALWKHDVWNAAANLNFCQYVFATLRGNRTKRFVIGRPLNIEAAKLSASYLVEAIERECKKQAKGKGKEYATQFKKGCAYMVSRRLYEKLDEAIEGKAQSSNGTSLMLRPLYEQTNRENIEQAERMGVEKQRREKLTADAAFMHGLDSGKELALTRPLGG